MVRVLNCSVFLFIHNWIEKYKVINGNVSIDVEAIKNLIGIQLLTPKQEIKSRLITIKAFTPEQTQIRGFTKFRVKVKANSRICKKCSYYDFCYIEEI